MKIYTITCHDVYNHGASLQAYALMKYLNNMGHNVQIINYKPSYLSNHYKIFKIANPKWDQNVFSRLIYLLLKVPMRIPELKRKKAFDNFTSTYLTLSPERYQSNEELKDKLPFADVYICGSDQIWNTVFQNGKDPAFYLDFAPKQSIKASYAASFSTEEIDQQYIPFVRKAVKSLDTVSVREKSGVAILNKLGIKDAIHVVDPTLLLSMEEWNQIAEYEFKEDYILIYDFDNNDLIRELAKKISEKKGLKIYSINPGKVNYADKYFKYVGPEVFVSLIRDASFILSNSFHAAVFSVVFQRNFAIVNRKESINTRMRDFLADIGLEDRLINADFNIKALLKAIDYRKSESILQGDIRKSKKYFDHILFSTKMENQKENL
ncbi:polysaccharide pyruvyl transferase family protein [Oceanobacillus piezotolerans]|uniref:Polysaccharide pyruvyl transferase family protein n=1 Tax=Oceanobacillus piezotolerans TaxID=2448030 RepID=A0A498DBC4_9BACI|nr:polysaccharide pyruvyl transferase family protein [Oceanobacillus piezotolerans]RLL42767.1 polysaccharide pyruvyl transferase family protein [Oceanobacillus piezotolerans]